MIKALNKQFSAFFLQTFGNFKKKLYLCRQL